ncbi:hypothetical protein [Streptomyces antarcticus]|uniref:hypothetical protein n=1 Tax=Streptomyces antarcticus TaxID=2996458 RepID=UPI003B836ECC
MPAAPLRAALAAASSLRLVPASPDLLSDAVLRLPLMDCARARTELDREPRHTSVEALQEFLAGLQAGAGMDTPPLAAHGTGGRLPPAAHNGGRSTSRLHPAPRN